MPRTSLLLGREFNGLNRQTAAHLLSEKESPATTDADGGDVAGTVSPNGILSARNGNKRTYTDSGGNVIKGVIPFFFQGTARGRVVASADGKWSPVATPWPADNAFANGPSWDAFTLSLQQSFIAPYTALVTVPPTDLSLYSNWGIRMGSLGLDVTTNILEAQISGAWVTLLDANATPMALADKPATGLLTAVRWRRSAGSAASSTFVLALLFGTQLSRTTLNG